MIIQTIISLLPFSLTFGIALAIHERALKSEREKKHRELRAQHREQAKYDMAEISVYAAYYGGYTYD
ncbi:MAG: hypothetical protein K2N83_02880 [Eubacterium sp.]|nr:hypothetical protein [Eubacterium sp.]